MNDFYGLRLCYYTKSLEDITKLGKTHITLDKADFTLCNKGIKYTGRWYLDCWIPKNSIKYNIQLLYRNTDCPKCKKELFKILDKLKDEEIDLDLKYFESLKDFINVKQ